MAVIRTPTHEDACKLFDFFRAAGIDSSAPEYWDEYEEETCFDLVLSDLRVQYCSSDWYEEQSDPDCNWDEWEPGRQLEAPWFMCSTDEFIEWCTFGLDSGADFDAADSGAISEFLVS